MSEEFKDKFTEVGALWKNRQGTGYSGKVKLEDGSEMKILVFANNKRKDNHPDFKIFIEKPQQQEEPSPPDDGQEPCPF